MVIRSSAIGELEAKRRAASTKLVICDNDGVLTDGTVYYSERGEELKQYSLRDGMGVERLRELGVATAILTRETTQFVHRRGEKLKLPFVWSGVHDKLAHLGRILEEAKLSIDQLAYIGDDVNDLGIITAITEGGGLTAAPVDAMSEVHDAVHLVCRSSGGRGAFREFAEWIRDRRVDRPSPAHRSKST